MQSEHLQQIMDYYIEDAQNHLTVIEQGLLNLQSTIEDPESISELFSAARCGIIGGANLLPASNLHINSIHKSSFCLVDCFKILQQQGSLKVDQKLQDLLMQVFYTLKGLIEQLREPSSLTEDKAKQVMLEIEAIREPLMAHLNRLVTRSALAWASPRFANGNAKGERSRAELSSASLTRSHNGNHTEKAIANPCDVQLFGNENSDNEAVAMLGASASLLPKRDEAQEPTQSAPDSADDFPCLEDLESLIDELSLDNSSS